MSELSLKRLTAGRDGVSIRSIVYHRITFGQISDEALDSVGFSDLKGGDGYQGILYGLPPTLDADETLLTVRLLRLPKTDRVPEREDWNLTWERLTKRRAETVPEDIQSDSQKAGGSSGLDDRVATLWAAHPSDETSFSFVTVDYQLNGWKFKLGSLRSETIGELKLQQTGSFWDVNGGVIIGVSLLEGFDRPKDSSSLKPDLALSVVGRFDRHGGHHDAPNLEQKMWTDVLKLAEKIT